GLIFGHETDNRRTIGGIPGYLEKKVRRGRVFREEPTTVPSPPTPLPPARPPSRERGATARATKETYFQRAASSDVPPLPGGGVCGWERGPGGEGWRQSGLDRDSALGLRRERVVRLASPEAEEGRVGDHRRVVARETERDEP